MDIQKLFDVITKTARDSRRRYHITLGDLLSACEKNPSATVTVDGVAGLGKEGSYRGYYEDLAFALTSEASTAEEVAAACRRGLSETYEGYKGGDYRYDERTPLWLASYGNCGPAITSLEVTLDEIKLSTKDVGI